MNAASHGAGPAISDPFSVDRNHRDHAAGSGSDEGFACGQRFIDAERALFHANSGFGRESGQYTGACDAGENVRDKCRVTRTPSLLTIQALLDVPSVIMKSASTSHASKAPCLRASVLASSIGQQTGCLDVATPPAQIGQRHDGNPFRTALLNGRNIEGACGHEQRQLWDFPE